MTHLYSLNQWFPTFLACDPQCDRQSVCSWAHISDVYDLLSVSLKRHFSSKHLTWFHLNNRLRPKEIKLYQNLFFPSLLSH